MKKKNGFGSGGPRNLYIIVALMVGCIAFYTITRLVDDTRERGELNYSQFMNMVDKGNVKNAAVSGSLIVGVTKDNKRFEATVPVTHDLLESLRKNGAEITLASVAGQPSIWHMLLFVSFLVVLS